MFRKNVFKLIILGLVLFLAACQSNASFTVSFNSNGGSAVEDITIGNDENVSMPSDPTRPGYTFKGWFFDQDEFKSPVTLTSILTKESTSNITVYAQWDVISYTLTYVLNGGVNHQDNPTTFTVKDDLTISNPSKTGFAFEGWYLDSAFTNAFNANSKPLENVTLYAKWNQVIVQQTITFESNGGSAVQSITQNVGSAVTAPANPTKTGFTFGGWYSDSGLTTAYTFSTMPSAAVTLYAKWNQVIVQQTITFESNGGSAVPSITQNVGSAVSAPANPTKTGFTFGGWYSDSGLTTAYTFSTTPSAAVTLYAKWCAVSYTVTWKNYDQTVLETDTVNYGETPTYDGITPVRQSTDTEEFTFTGWTPSVNSATSDITYVATYSSTPIETKQPYNATELNTIFGYDIYKTMPAFVSSDAELFDYSENGVVEVYIDIFDWTVADADAYIALLEAGYTYDAAQDAHVLGNYFIYVYIDDETYPGKTVYGIAIYEVDDSGEETGTPFDPAGLNAIFGFDIYKTMPAFVSSDAELFDYSENGVVEVYIDIFDWTEADADAYIALLEAGYTYDATEDAYVLGNYFFYVFEDDQTYPGKTVYGISIYEVDDSGEQPVDEIYYAFNVQDTLTVLSSSYKTNPEVLLDFAGLEGKAIIKAAFLANITDTPPTGLTKGIIFASNVKDTPSALAYLDIDTLGHMINAISFEIEARDAFESKLLGAKLQVFDGTTWVDFQQGDFYSQLSTDKVTVTISGFNSSHIRLVFTGAGQTSNGGQFRIDQVTLMQEEQVVIYPTWTDLMNVLKTELNDSALDTLIPELENLTSIQLSKVGTRSYLFAGSFVFLNHLELIQSYINELISEGFVLNQDLSDFYDTDVYALKISDDIAYAVYMLSDGEIATMGLIKYDPVIEKIELNSLKSMQSINEFEVQSFGESGLPSTGIYDVLVVPVEISGKPFPLNYKSQIELTFNGTSVQTGWESVSSYYEKSSYGKLDLNFVVLDKYVTTQQRTYYEGFAEGAGDQYAIKEALLALDPTIDFSKYDSNLDGAIDSIIFIFSVEYDYDLEPWWAWVYAAKHGEATGLVLDTKSFEYYMWASYYFLEDDLPGSYNPTVNAETYIHELGHLMGLVDYYSYTHDSGPLGGFDMMDYNAGDHGPTSKLLLGWLQPMVAVEGTYEVSLESFTLDEDGLNSAIIIPYASDGFTDGDAFDEYIIIMYYTPGGLYDGHKDTDYILETPGLVIYHVDARLYQPTGLFESYFMYNNDGASDFFLEILEVDKNNSLPGSNSFGVSDMLTSGVFDLSSYSWHQGGQIDISIELLSNVTVSNSISFNLTVN